MRNKKIWLVILIVTLTLAVSSCKVLEDAFTVPSWAQGTWYLTPKSEIVNIRIDEVATITSKKLIPTAELVKLIPGAKETDVSYVSVDNEKVHFEVLQVRKGNSPNEIIIEPIGGITPFEKTIYK